MLVCWCCSKQKQEREKKKGGVDLSQKPAVGKEEETYGNGVLMGAENCISTPWDLSQGTLHRECNTAGGGAGCVDTLPLMTQLSCVREGFLHDCCAYSLGITLNQWFEILLYIHIYILYI